MKKITQILAIFLSLLMIISSMGTILNLTIFAEETSVCITNNLLARAGMSLLELLAF